MKQLIIFINLLVIIITLGENKYFIFDTTYQNEFIVPKDDYPDSYYFYFKLALPETYRKLQVTIKYPDKHDFYSIYTCGFENISY